MSKFTFNATQELRGFYECYVTIEADSEADAREKMSKMSNHELEDCAHTWEQNTDNATGYGRIEIHGLDCEDVEEDLEDDENLDEDGEDEEIN